MEIVDHLIEDPVMPIPPGARAGTIAAADGVRLRWAAFDVARPRGTVLALQGRGEYMECWFETVRDLQARGFAVLAFDWRGQGGSQRLDANPRKGHVSTFAAYDFDLDAVLRLVAPTCPKPWYVLAHSTGALIAAANVRRLAAEVRRMVFLAPFFGLGEIGPAEPISRFLARGMRAFGFGRDWVPGGGATAIHTNPFETNRLTSDPERHARNAEMSWRHPEIAVGSPTVAWLDSAFEAMNGILRPEALAAWRLPTLILAAGDDRVVSNRAIEGFAARTVGTDLLVIPGARHELLKERDRFREQVWSAFDAFVPGTAPPAAEPPAVVLAASPAEPRATPEPEPPRPPEPVAAPPVAEPPPAPASDDDAVLAAIGAVTAAAAAAALPILRPGDGDAPEPAAARPEAPLSGDVGEQIQHDPVEGGIAAGDDAPAVGGAAAVPGSEDAAGPLDDRDQGGDVVGLQPGLDDDVDEAGRDHAVGVAIDPVARQPNP